MNYIRKTREIPHNKWIVARDCVQMFKAFAILNFYDSGSFDKFMIDIDSFKDLEYFKQTLESNGNSYPSIFIVPSSSEFLDHKKLKNLILGAMIHYNLDSALIGMEAGVYVVYKNRAARYVGNSIFGSNDGRNFLTDHYKIDDYYYTIL